MARRVRIPAADDLFRPTGSADSGVRAVPDPQPASSAAAESKRSSGRVKHDEKMTVYITSDELLEIEHARLSLRKSHALSVDRGRLVRAAVAMVLEDFEAHGDDSALVRRLRES